MKLNFLGTGAADWPVNEFRYQDLKEEYKRYSGIIIEDSIMIDCGPCTMEAIDTFHMDLNQIRYILITHSHEDHYNPCELIKLLDQTNQKLVHIYLHESILNKLPYHHKLVIHPLKTMEKVKLDNFSIQALKANHSTEDRKEVCMHYIIEEKEKSIFYGCDGAWLLSETWEVMKEYRFDAVILDATIATVCYQGVFGHNNFEMIKLMQLAFLHGGVLKPQCRLLLSHTAVTLCPSTKDYDCMAKAYGMEVVKDGQIIKI